MNSAVRQVRALPAFSFLPTQRTVFTRFPCWLIQRYGFERADLPAANRRPKTQQRRYQERAILCQESTLLYCCYAPAFCKNVERRVLCNTEFSRYNLLLPETPLAAEAPFNSDCFSPRSNFHTDYCTFKMNFPPQNDYKKG